MLGAPLLAQEASVLVGGVYARYADSVSGTAGVTALQLSGSTPNTAGTLTGSLSRFSSGEWVTQFSGYGAAVASLGGGFSFGLSAGGDANHIEGSTWNGQVSGGLLGVLGVGQTLATAGVSIGTIRTVHDSTVASSVVSARLAQTLAQGIVLSGGVVGVRSDTTRFADLSVGLNLTGAKIRAAFSGVIRSGDLDDDPWGQGHVEYDVLPFFTYEVTAGRYPQSLVGFTDGLYLTTGVRLRLAGGTPAARAPERPVEIEPLGQNRVRVTLKYGGDARTLEIVGNWNGWLPLTMTRERDDRWSAELFLEHGIYQYAIVVNGDVWTVPEGVLTETDDFGGEIATLVVRGGTTVRP